MKTFFGWLGENAEDLTDQLRRLAGQLDGQNLEHGFNYRDFNAALQQAQATAAGYERRGYIPPGVLDGIEQAMNNMPQSLPRIILATIAKIQQWQPTVAKTTGFQAFGDDDE
jgi:hypothetical protein